MRRVLVMAAINNIRRQQPPRSVRAKTTAPDATKNHKSTIALSRPSNRSTVVRTAAGVGSKKIPVSDGGPVPLLKQSYSERALSESFQKFNINDTEKSATTTITINDAPERIPNSFPNKTTQKSSSLTTTGSTVNNGVQEQKKKKNQLTLQDIATDIERKKIRKIIVMSGAGMSTPSGIPDFRSKNTGLYDNLQKYNIPFPEAIFDIDFFRKDPAPFFQLAKELYPGSYRPNYSHYLIRLLHDKGLLLRMYTQNIDGLELLAGIPPTKLVEAHGTFCTATCMRCKKPFSGTEIKAKVMNNQIPKCNKVFCGGVIKPDIVFFGGNLPRRFYLFSEDFDRTDLVIVLGTSLQVEPFASIISAAGFQTPRVLFNRTVVYPFNTSRRRTDMAVVGGLISGLKMLVDKLGWSEELETFIRSSESKQSADSIIRYESEPASEVVADSKPIQATGLNRAELIITDSNSSSSSSSTSSSDSSTSTSDS